MDLPKSLIVWDLETTGLDPKTSEIIEIGAMRVENGDIVDRKAWLLNHDIEISDTTTELTGITKEMIDKDGVDPDEALAEFMGMLTPGTPHLTHNGIRFDIPFLTHHLEKRFKSNRSAEEIERELNKYAIDSAVIVKAKKLDMEWKWGETFKEYADRVMRVIAKGVKYNVGICCEEMGISMEGLTQHRALSDVELTYRIYQEAAWPRMYVVPADSVQIENIQVVPGEIVRVK